MNQIPIHNVGGPFNQLTASRNRLRGAKEEGILLPDCLRATASSLPWVSSLPAHPEDFRLANLHKLVSQFLKSCPLSLSPQPTPPPAPAIYISYWFCFSAESLLVHTEWAPWSTLGLQQRPPRGLPRSLFSRPHPDLHLCFPCWGGGPLLPKPGMFLPVQSTESTRWGADSPPTPPSRSSSPLYVGLGGWSVTTDSISPLLQIWASAPWTAEGREPQRLGYMISSSIHATHTFLVAKGETSGSIRITRGWFLAPNSSGHIGPAGLTWDLVQGSIQSNLNIFVSFSVKSSHFSLYWFESHHYISNLFIYRVKQYQFSWTTWNCQHWDIFNLQKLVISCDPIGSASMNQDL